ncbi:MAG: hypothetical protein ACFCVD_09105 [Nodosilinea sp.]
MPMSTRDASSPLTGARPQRLTPVPPEILVGGLVPPLLLGLLAARVLAHGLTQVGLVSEQIFQGERLPNLNISPLTSADEQ